MTPAQINKLKQGCYPIPQCPGVRLEVRATRKTWTLRRRDDAGLLKQQVLGHWPEMSLAGAIEAATVARRTLGKPPTEKAIAVRSLLHAYCLGHIRVNRKDWFSCEARIWRYVGELADREVTLVGRAEAHGLIASLVGKPSAQRWMRMELRASWEYGMDTGLLPEMGANPWTRIRVPPAGVRSRVLSDGELVTLFRWLDGSKLGLTREAMLLTLSTCCRSGELLQMRVRDLDLARGEWHLRTAKNGMGRTVYLNTVAIAVLRDMLTAMGERANGDALLFTMKGQHVFANALFRVRDRIGIDAFGMHDLRRTGRTALARIGCPDEVGERLVGHAIGGVKAIYNQHSYAEEQREWMAKWGAKLMALVG